MAPGAQRRDEALSVITISALRHERSPLFLIPREERGGVRACARCVQSVCQWWLPPSSP